MSTFKVLAAAALACAAVSCYAPSALSEPAAGCAAFSGSRTYIGGSVNLKSSYVYTGTSSVTGLKKGDTITMTNTFPLPYLGLYKNGQDDFIWQQTSTLTYIVPADISTTVYEDDDENYPTAKGQAVTWSCRPAGSGSNIQTSASQIEGQNSNFALNDMLDQVILNSESSTFAPLSGNASGLNAMVAPDQKVTATADAPVMMSESPWRMFAAGRYTGATGSISGGQFNGVFGTSYRLGEGKALGLFGGFETFNYTDATPSTFSGTGESIGGFAAGTFHGRLKLDARLYTTFLNYTITSGGATGNTTANRVGSSLSAAYEFGQGPTSIAPYVRGTGLFEWLQAYTDSAATAHAARNLSEGIAAAGLRIAHTAPTTNGSITPYVSAEADYIFGNSVLPGFASTQGLSGKVNAGVNWAGPRGIAIGVDAGYAGIGSSIGAWSGEATLSVPF